MTSSTVSSDSVIRQARRDLCGIDSHPVFLSSKHVERQERGVPCSSEISEEQLLTEPTKNLKPNENVDPDQERGDLCHSDIPEWLQEFRENLVDDRIPERRDSHASSSHEPSLEPTPARSADLGKHSVYTHFPKDRNCEICQRTKITRAACRRRIGGAVPRAEHVGGLITTDHKVLSEGCESRNNHRYAIVVQDLATQWIQSCPCKTETSQETQRSLQKILKVNNNQRYVVVVQDSATQWLQSYPCKSTTSQETQKNVMKFLQPTRKPRVIYTNNSLEFGKSCEDLFWNHCTSTPHKSETIGIAERAVRRVKEGTSAVLLQPGLGNEWWADAL